MASSLNWAAALVIEVSWGNMMLPSGWVGCFLTAGYCSFMETLGEVVGAALMGLLWSRIGLWVARWRVWSRPGGSGAGGDGLGRIWGHPGALAAGSPAEVVGRLALLQAIFASRAVVGTRCLDGQVTRCYHAINMARKPSGHEMLEALAPRWGGCPTWHGARDYDPPPPIPAPGERNPSRESWR